MPQSVWNVIFTLLTLLSQLVIISQIQYFEIQTLLFREIQLLVIGDACIQDLNFQGMVVRQANWFVIKGKWTKDAEFSYPMTKFIFPDAWGSLINFIIYRYIQLLNILIDFRTNFYDCFRYETWSECLPLKYLGYVQNCLTSFSDENFLTLPIWKSLQVIIWNLIEMAKSS